MPHKLLLADDSVTIQRVIELTFADEDVHVLAVGDGKKAIESIQSNRPDIVLADVGMPERDGYEVAEFIKRNPQLASIPVLLLTGAFEPIDETRARAVGCDGVLVKPFEPQMVINRVKDLLAGRRSGGLWGGKSAPAPPEHVPAPPAVDQTTPADSGAPASAATSASLEEYFDRLDAAFASVEAATEARSASSVVAHPSPAPSTSLPSSTAALSTDDFPGWDPDLTGDPERLAPASATPVQSAGAEPAPSIEAPTPPVTLAPPPSAGVSPQQTIQLRQAPPPAASEEPTLQSPPIPFRPVTPAAPTPAVEPRSVAQAPRTVEKPAASPSPASGTAPAYATAASMPSLAEAFAALLSAEQDRRVSPSTVGAASVSDDTMDEIVRKVIERMTDTVVRNAVLDVAERLVREEIERIKAH